MQITIPDIVLSAGATTWAEENLTPKWQARGPDGEMRAIPIRPEDRRVGVEILLARAQGEIVDEFRVGTPNPVIEDVTDIMFHTFTCGKDRQEFILSPTNDGRLLLDICERVDMAPLESGPMKGQTLSIPKQPEN